MNIKLQIVLVSLNTGFILQIKKLERRFTFTVIILQKNWIL